MFVRRGTAGARMQEIAEQAGVNQALLHYYFRSKDRLSQAVFREAASRLVPAVVRLLGSDDSLEQKIEQFVHLYIDTVRQHPFLPGYILSELHHQPERLPAVIASAAGELPPPAATALISRLDAQLRAAAGAGLIRPVAAEQFLLSVVGLCVIPFIARPMLNVVFGVDEAAFNRILDERRASLPQFILNGFRP